MCDENQTSYLIFSKLNKMKDLILIELALHVSGLKGFGSDCMKKKKQAVERFMYLRNDDQIKKDVSQYCLY